MSASLVGSEMCIRDRCLASAEVGDPFGCNSGRWKGSSTCGASGARCRNPVSYTHLTLPTICSV
eukprot:5008338-Alexandrium_andersonii.AAC.1